MKYVFEARIVEDNKLPFSFGFASLYGGKEVYKSNMHVVLNWHENVEILYFTKGIGTVRNGAGTYDVSAGDIAVVNSNDLHSIYTDTHVEYYYFIPDKDFLTSNEIDMDNIFFEILFRDETASKYFEAIIENYSKSGKLAVAAIRASVLNFFIYIGQNYCVDNAVTGKSEVSNYIKDAVEYIDSNLHRHITLDEIAAHVGISKYHFSREFKRIIGDTVVSYINVKRCNLAGIMLSEKKYTIAEIADKCGFEDFSYFSKTFKKYVGISPTKFKKGGTK